jgi:hypothetical protein
VKVSSENDQHPLLLAAMMQLVANYPAVVWIVGDTWVRCENCEYTIDADESVTREQVRQLLINADWNAEQWLGD